MILAKRPRRYEEPRNTGLGWQTQRPPRAREARQKEGGERGVELSRLRISHGVGLCPGLHERMAFPPTKIGRVDLPKHEYAPGKKKYTIRKCAWWGCIESTGYPQIWNQPNK